MEIRAREASRDGTCKSRQPLSAEVCGAFSSCDGSTTGPLCRPWQVPSETQTNWCAIMPMAFKVVCMRRKAVSCHQESLCFLETSCLRWCLGVSEKEQGEMWSSRYVARGGYGGSGEGEARRDVRRGGWAAMLGSCWCPGLP